MRRHLSAHKALFRTAGFLTLAGLLIATLACIDRPLKRAVPDPAPVWIATLPQSVERDLDILFVIDDSGSMADEQALLQAQFSALMQTLRDMRGGLPNVHIGVASTDLGTGMFQITYCEDVGGDGGNLLTGNCPNPTGAPYVVVVEPTGCDIEKELDEKGGLASCPSHSCTAANCTDPNTTLVVDDNGCPRCRNYGGEQLEDVFSCMAGLGTLGCGFEQPLEAMYKALDDNPANTGFLRDSALLAVVLITDEDDCSAANPQLFDNSQTTMDSTLGPLTSFRCFEFGITCDVNARTAQGLRQDCQPREDAGALLQPTSRYVQFLQNLKGDEGLVVAAIAGPVQNDSVTVGLDEYSQPEVQFSCSTERGGAVPGIRIRSFVRAFNDDQDMSWAYSSICSPTYADALKGVAEKIAVKLDQCPPAPLQGCSDPAVMYGLPGDGQACNDTCTPRCSVQDITETQKTTVPPCLEVCPNGPCPGNTDASQAYAQGHPSRIDANLPVAACWHVNYNEQCTEANGAELLVARRAEPPPKAVTEVSCRNITAREELCNDGVDNDEDCLVDLDDPDCFIQ